MAYLWYVTAINLKIDLSMTIDFHIFRFGSNVPYFLGGLGLGLLLLAIQIIMSHRVRTEREKFKTSENETISERLMSIFDGIAYTRIMDDRWSFKTMSIQSYKITGYSSEEMVSNPEFSYFNLISVKYQSYLKEKMQECVLSRNNFEEEYSIRTKSGDEKWVRDYGQPVYDNEGNLIYIEGFIIDITKEKELSFKSFFNEARYKSLIDNTEFPVMVFNNGKIIYANPATASFLKAKSRKEIEGMGFIDLVTEDYKEFYKARYERIKNTKTSNLPTNYKFKCFDGTEAFARLSTHLFYFEDDMYIHISLIEVKDSEYNSQLLKKTQKRNRDLILYMHEGIGVFQRIPDENDGKLIFANKNFSRFVIGQTKNLIYKTFRDIFSNFENDEIKLIFDKIKTEKYLKQIMSNVNKHYYDYMFYTNQENEIIVQITNVTEKVLINQKYIHERDQLNDILEATKTVTWEWDLSTGKLKADDRWRKIYGFDESFLKNFTFKNFRNLIYSGDVVSVGRRVISLIRSSNDDSFSVEFRTKHKDGHFIWGLYRGKVFERYPNGKPKRISGTFQDISDIKNKEQQIEYLSLHDHLTGLYNRRALDLEINSLDRPENYPIAVMLADVDGLKIINDAFGHDDGDKLLVETAKALIKFQRPKDILSRIGGDEFLLISPKTDGEEAEKRIRQMKRELGKSKIKGIPISISIGFAIKYKVKQDLLEIQNQAESQMYDYKFNHSNTRYEILEMIRKNLYKKYPLEKSVSELTKELAMKLARVAKLDKSQISTLEMAADYYNIGVVGIERAVLGKKAQIDQTAIDDYRKHVEIGFRILSSIFKFNAVASIVLYHHEKYDGNGYPSGLSKENIPIESRIIAICGAYSRNYLLHKNNKKASTVKMLATEKGKSFDPQLVDLFIAKVV